jgi:hypothetical protein
MISLLMSDSDWPHQSDWSRWFAISNPPPIQVSILWVGLQKSKLLNLDVKNIFA